MKIMKESLLGVSAVSAFAIPCAMVFAASEFDWHLGLMRENPVLFFKVVLKISGVIIGGLLLGGLLQNIATRNSWMKRRFKWLFFAVYCVGLCLIMVCFSPFPSRIDIMTHVEMMKAERGDVDAQYSLAQCYSYGKGVETNEEEAVKWLCKAAEQGHADAQYSLAQCYSYGKEPLLSDVQESIVLEIKEPHRKDNDHEAVAFLQHGFRSHTCDSVYGACAGDPGGSK